MRRLAAASQDRPALPLRVIHKPGALAAGMETLLTVEIVAETLGDFVGEVGEGGRPAHGGSSDDMHGPLSKLSLCLRQ